MRGWNTAEYATTLNPNLTDAESSAQQAASINATGFTANGPSSATYIYIAIRRGPMQVPTVGTTVFAPALATSNGISATFTTNFPVDLAMFRSRALDGNSFNVMDRLRGNTPDLRTAVTNAEASGNSSFDLMTTWVESTGYSNGTNEILEAFKRAPSFFDVVCYTGTGSARTVTHNLAAVPQLIICKRRDTAGYDWITYCAFLNGGVTPQDWWVKINGSTQQFNTGAYWNSTAPTSSVFTVNTAGDVNASGGTYVAYLFATCAGVSKVGSYTGTGATQTVACGFGAGGARFVLVKRTDTTGAWYVWDSARGMVSGTDPSILLNDGAAEVNANSVYAISTGFQIVSTAAGINASGGTYIFLAIA
jgi:hypothetical protein